MAETRGRAQRALAAAATCVVLVTGLTTGIARAVTAPLPYGGGFGEIAVDPASGRVFVSSPTARAVSVFAPDGSVQQLLQIGGEPNSILVDGPRLYVVRHFPAGIDVFDTATLAPIGTLADGQLEYPFQLVKAGGRLWTSTGSCQGQSNLVAVDPVTGNAEIFTPTNLVGCVHLAGSPANPALLLGWDRSSPPNVVRYDVAGPGLTVAAQGSLQGHEHVADIAFNPDGSSFVVAASTPAATTQFRTSDLQPDGVTYATGPYGVSVATTSHNGDRIAVGNGAGIEVVPVNDPLRVQFTQSFGTSPTDRLAPRGLAWSPTGTTLYAVTVDYSASGATLHTLAVAGSPKLRTTTLLETSSPAAVYGEKFTLTASVAAQAPGAAIPTGTVSFFNGSNFIAKVSLRNGKATLGPRTMPLGTNWVTAQYNGNAADQSSVSAPLAQVVNRARTVTSLSSSPSPSAPQESVTLRAAVTVVAPGAGQPAEKVAFYDGTRLIGTARVAQGEAVLTTTSLTVGTRSLTAAYVGSARFEPSTSAVVSHLVVAAP